VSAGREVDLVGHVDEGVPPHQDVEDGEGKRRHLESILHRSAI